MLSFLPALLTDVPEPLKEFQKGEASIFIDAPFTGDHGISLSSHLPATVLIYMSRRFSLSVLGR
jgi:hypothetical protein